MLHASLCYQICTFDLVYELHGIVEFYWFRPQPMGYDVP